MFDNSATNDKFLTVCAPNENFPQHLRDDNRMSISDYNGCTEAVQARCREAKMNVPSYKLGLLLLMEVNLLKFCLNINVYTT